MLLAKVATVRLTRRCGRTASWMWDAVSSTAARALIGVVVRLPVLAVHCDPAVLQLLSKVGCWSALLPALPQVLVARIHLAAHPQPQTWCHAPCTLASTTHAVAAGPPQACWRWCGRGRMSMCSPSPAWCPSPQVGGLLRLKQLSCCCAAAAASVASGG